MTTRPGPVLGRDGAPLGDEGSTSGLAAFITFDQITCGCAIAAMLAVHRLVMADPYLLVLSGLVGAALAGLVVSGVLLRRGHPRGAVWAVAASNWGVAVGAVSIATFCMPLMVVASLLPAVVAPPHLTRSRLRVLNALSVLTAMAVTATATVQDVTGFSARVPDAIRVGVLIGFIPLMAATVLVVLARSNDHLTLLLARTRTSNDRLRASERDLAEQARQLRASRARVVAAADRERRRIERDLHDGAQQRLLALAIGLRCAADRTAAGKPITRGALDDLAAEAAAAATELRDLAHGLYPPVLGDHGLVAALEVLVASTPVEARLQAAVEERLAPEVEAAVYFCCSEALHNAAKHAGPGARVVVRVGADRARHQLRFSVSDDGPGFGASAVRADGGLAGLADRLGALGGRIDVTSSPTGTTVGGHVPLEPPEPASVPHPARAHTVTPPPPSPRTTGLASPVATGAGHPTHLVAASR